MRPIRLELSAFGPYLEHTVIDFEKLNEAGLFLITGQTVSYTHLTLPTIHLV